MKAKVKYLYELIEYLNSLFRSTTSHNSIVAFERYAPVVTGALKDTGDDEHLRLEFLKQPSEAKKVLLEGVIRNKPFNVVIDRHTQTFSNALGKLGICCSGIGAMEVSVDSLFRHRDTDREARSADPIHLNHAGKFSSNNVTMVNEFLPSNNNRSRCKKDVVFTDVPVDINDIDLIAFVNWDNLPYGNELIDNFLRRVVSPSGKKNFHFLFDFNDALSKSVFQIDEILDIISCFSTYGKVTFSLSGDVACKIWMVLNGYDIHRQPDVNVSPGPKQVGLAIFNTMKIETLLIHSFNQTHVFIKNHVFETEGRSIQRTVEETFAREIHNAGLCFGMLVGLPVEHCMLLGSATMGAYLQTGCSPDTIDIIAYLLQWIEEGVTENVVEAV